MYVLNNNKAPMNTRRDSKGGLMGRGSPRLNRRALNNKRVEDRPDLDNTMGARWAAILDRNRATHAQAKTRE